MLSNRQTAVAVGVLFLTATVTFVTSDTIIRSALSRPDFLISSAADAPALRTAALLALVCGIAAPAIALLVYPLFKPHSERLALGYVALRLGDLGAVLLFAVTPLLVVALGERLLDRSVDPAAAPHLGSLLQALYDVAIRMVFLFVGVSGNIFAYLLYRSRLIPRWLAVLGLIGYAALLVGSVLSIFRLIHITQGVPALLFTLPGGLFELILPIWLFVKGFARAPGGAAVT